MRKTREVYGIGKNKCLFPISEVISNPNMLINSYFIDPINQRGKSIYSGLYNGIEYTIDRWGLKAYRSNHLVSATIDKQNKCLTFGEPTGKSSLIQYLEEDLSDKEITLSIKLLDYDMKSVSGKVSHNEELELNIDYESNMSNGVIKGLVSFDSEKGYYKVEIISNQICSIEWVKLELGLIATPIPIPNKTIELLKCQRYYLKTSGIYVGFVSDSRKSLYISEKRIRQMRITPSISLNQIIIRSYEGYSTIAPYDAPIDIDTSQIEYTNRNEIAIKDQAEWTTKNNIPIILTCESLIADAEIK